MWPASSATVRTSRESGSLRRRGPDIWAQRRRAGIPPALLSKDCRLTTRVEVELADQPAVLGPQSVLAFLDREQILTHLLDASLAPLRCHVFRATAAPSAMSTPATRNRPKDIGRVGRWVHPPPPQGARSRSIRRPIVGRP